MTQTRSKQNEMHIETIGNTLIVRPGGACDTDCTKELEGILSRVDGASEKDIIFDASRVKYIDTNGFRWLMAQFRKLQEIGGSMVVAGLKGPAERAFKLLQLDKFIPSTSSVDAALARIKRNDKN